LIHSKWPIVVSHYWQDGPSRGEPILTMKTLVDLFTGKRLGYLYICKRNPMASSQEIQCREKEYSCSMPAFSTHEYITCLSRENSIKYFDKIEVFLASKAMNMEFQFPQPPNLPQVCVIWHVQDWRYKHCESPPIVAAVCQA